MSVLTEKTIQVIAQKNIHPIPRWVDVVRNGAYWLGGGVLILFSALATATALHALFEIDWDAYVAAHFSLGEILLSGVPFFSLVLLVVFLVVAFFLLVRTRRGYRYPLPYALGIFLGISLITGYFFERSPLDEPTERFLLSAIPQASQGQSRLFPSAERQWSQPNRGLLGGEVLSADEAKLLLMDSSQQEWTVDYTEASVAPDALLRTNTSVKVIGKSGEEHTFKAQEVRSWERSSSREHRESSEPEASEGNENEER